jgi:iron complex transport system substrate-binding protein
MGKPQYPREAIDSDNVRVRMSRPAYRIASQYWAIDEYVYSVVPPERVIAVSESAYLPQVSNVYNFVQHFHPAISTDPERVLRLDPDLILVSSNGRADYTSLVRSSGVPLYRMQTLFHTLAEVEKSIRLIGYLTGEDDAAEREATRFHTAIEKARALRPPNAAPPRILGFGGSYSYGDETLFHDIVRQLSGINVAAEGGLKGYDSVNSEQIIRWNPEWIVTEADPGKTKQVLEKLLTDPAIGLTQAARNGHILVLEQRVFLPMSPFTSLLVTAMAEAIYGTPHPGKPA